MTNIWERIAPQKLLFRTKAGITEVVGSVQDAQKGYNLGLLCSSVGGLANIQASSENSPESEAQIMVFTEDAILTLPIESARET